MTEEGKRSQGKSEGAADAATVAEASEGTGQAAGRTDKADKRVSGILTFAIASTILGLSFLKQFMRKSAAKDRRVYAAVPAPPGEGAKPTGESILAEDSTLEMESEAEVARRRKLGTPLVLFAFAAGMAGGVGFIYLYWTGGSNQLLGGTLAICLGGFGAVLVLYAQWMMRHELVMAPREEMPSSTEERQDVSKDYSSGARDVQRRGLLKWMGGGAAGLLAAMVVSMVRSLARTAPGESLFTNVWKPGQHLMTVGGKPLTVDSLQPGSSMTVFPEGSLGSEKTQTVLIRVDPSLLQLPKGRENWAPMGYIAYSRVCTHAGCAVGMFEARSNLLLCPCHQSTFDVLRGAVPTGGPAARPLPQLPLYVDNAGNLCARGGFTSPPGPGFTGMPS